MLAIGAAIAGGWLGVRRDFFFLLVYGQSLIYVDVAPTLASADIPFAVADRYLYFQWIIAALFQLPLLVIYVWRKRRVGEKRPDRAERLSQMRAVLLFGAGVAMAVAYYVIGARHGLLYRRAGDMITRQLELTLLEFALFRSFGELGSFLVALQFLVLRRLEPALRSRWMTAAFVFTAGGYLAYAFVNSRMLSLLFLGTIYGVYLGTERRQLWFRSGAALGALVAAVVGLYSFRVAANLRQTVELGGPLLTAANFLPFKLDRGNQLDPLTSRLNGLDLIVLIGDNVETYGPAWGRAWVMPFIVSLDPIVRTDLTVQAKRVALTTSKSFLLLMYAGVGLPDYYSCLLTDAYGNLGLVGFAVAAVVLASLLAWASGTLMAASRPVVVVLGVFVITRLLPFEQEFGTLLFGWIKAVPLCVLFTIVYPLRPGKETSLPAGS